ncbi:MAG: TRAP transporter large permease subunit, partial [Pseudomonadota bacterium]
LGYDQNLAIGTVCASGSLGTMIPPSIVLIIYGLVTETSIQALFTAAFVPGAILASCYLAYIVIRTQLNPALAPLPEPTEDEMYGWAKPVRFLAFTVSMFILLSAFVSGFILLKAVIFQLTDRPPVMVLGRDAYVAVAQNMAFLAIATALMIAVFKLHRVQEAWNMGKGLAPPLVVVLSVLGSIYGGITGITEAAGIGTVAVLFFILIRGEMTWDLFYQSLQRTFKSTGTILMVTFGATCLAGAYSIAGGPAYVANLITGADLTPLTILLIMMAIFLVLGALMDWVGIVLLVMPVFLPIVLQIAPELGLSPSEARIWFGILFCVNMQVSFLSPPFGPAAFYLKSVAPPHITLPDIFKSFLPFICLQIFVLALVLFFPQLTQVLL